MSEFEEKMFTHEIEMHLRAESSVLDYENLNFVLKVIPKLPQDSSRTDYGYSWALMLSAAYGSTYCINTDEVLYARNVAQLAAGDTILSAYWIDGPDGAQCASFSKVVRFTEDGIPAELLHLWPLKYPKRAIDINRLDPETIENKNN